MAEKEIQYNPEVGNKSKYNPPEITCFKWISQGF